MIHSHLHSSLFISNLSVISTIIVIIDIIIYLDIIIYGAFWEKRQGGKRGSWCMGMTQRDVMGREVGGGFMFGNACKKDFKI